MKLKLIFGLLTPHCGSRALPMPQALAQPGLLCLTPGRGQLTVGEMDGSSIGSDFYCDFFRTAEMGTVSQLSHFRGLFMELVLKGVFDTLNRSKQRQWRTLNLT